MGQAFENATLVTLQMAFMIHLVAVLHTIICYNAFGADLHGGGKDG